MTLRDLEDLIKHHAMQEKFWTEGTQAHRSHARWLRALRQLREEMLEAHEAEKLFEL